MALPRTFKGIDAVMSARPWAGFTVMTPILGAKSGVGKNFPDIFCRFDIFRDVTVRAAVRQAVELDSSVTLISLKAKDEP